MESVQQSLSVLVSRPDVSGAAFVSGEGLLLAARLPDGADTEAIAALGAGLLRDGGQLAGAVGRRGPDRVVLDSADGMILACRLGDGTALVILAAAEADAGLLLYHLRQQHAALAALL